MVYTIGDELGDFKGLSLSCAALKNCRQIELHILQRQCPREGVHIYLAELITSNDYDTPTNNEIANTAIELPTIIDLDGHVSFKKSYDCRGKPFPGRLVLK